MNIISFAQNAWHGPWMNRQQLLSRLGKNHQIIYSNGLWNIWQRNQIEFKQAPFSGRFTATDNVLIDTPPKYLLRRPGSPMWDNLIIRLGILRWKHKFSKKESEPLMAYVFHPSFWPLVKQLKPTYLIYHAYDLFRLAPGWNKKLAENEDNLLRHANLSFGSSQTIVDDLNKKSTNDVVFLPNGVDFDLFTDPNNGKGQEPDDMKTIPHPRIGYIGNINRKVDLPLILELAKRNDSWQFVLVGGIANLDETTSNSLESLRQTPNIHMLGEKSPVVLAKYANCMDVNLMSYRTSDKLWTQAIYPLKLHEYLASGNPVVSADIPAVNEFSHVVKIVRNNTTHWENAIKEGLNENNPTKRLARVEVARHNSWSERVKTLERYINTMS